MQEFVHTTVLLEETVASVLPHDGGKYIDCTLGGAGHTRRLLECSGPDGKVLALDQDETAIANAQRTLAQYASRLTVIRRNFRDVAEAAAEGGFERVDGVIYDLGVSSPQFDEGERGFSYRFDAPLDMRMDNRQPLTAAQIVNEYNEQELAKIFFEYGEEKFSRRIAERILKRRNEEPITSTQELADIIRDAIPAAARRTGPHPARRVFQALRIAVNDELEALRDSLQAAFDLLHPTGRLAVITFHSLEDRIVKHMYAEWGKGCVCPPDFPICQCGRTPKANVITRKPIVPSEEEVERNPRARSAKLRVVEKTVDS